MPIRKQMTLLLSELKKLYKQQQINNFKGRHMQYMYMGIHHMLGNENIINGKVDNELRGMINLKNNYNL